MIRTRALLVGGLVVAFALVAAGCLMRNPTLTDATPTSEAVNFATTDQSNVPVVTYGPSPSCNGSSANATLATLVAPFTVQSNTEYEWTAQLTGLTADTTYCYHLTQGSSDLQNGAATTFTTALTAGSTTPFSFGVIGDFGGGTTDETNVLSRVRASNASFVVSVGDNAYPDGTQSDYGDVTGGNVFANSDWPVGQRQPWFLAQGNHGFDTSLPYLQNFPETSVTSQSSGRMQEDSYCCMSVMQQANTFASAWYAFNWGNARFYVLEGAWSDNFGGFQGDFEAHWNPTPTPGCSNCGAELQWLTADLTAHASTPLKFAFFHYPLHSDGGDGSDTYLDGPNGLEGLLATNGVKIVFNGHTHDYERNTPQIPLTPMVSYITGTGGADFLSTVQGCSSFDAYAIGGSGTSCNAPAPASDSHVFGYLLVSVSGTAVTVTPTDENGNTFDVQTYHF